MTDFKGSRLILPTVTMSSPSVRSVMSLMSLEEESLMSLGEESLSEVDEMEMAFERVWPKPQTGSSGNLIGGVGGA